MNAFLVWGAGGHGKVIADVLRACGHRVVGYVDASSEPGRVVEPGGARIVMSEEAFLAQIRESPELPFGADAVALAIGDNSLRFKRSMDAEHLYLPPLVHPAAVVSPSVRLGRGAAILPGAVVNAHAELGAAVIVNTNAVVEHDCVVDDCAHISPGAVLAGGVRVGRRSWIGAGAVVSNGVTIGADVVVGAGAVVIRDLPDGVTAVGVPARVVKGPADRIVEISPET